MTRPLQVLLVEDSEADAKLLLVQLERIGYVPEHERVHRAEALKEALRERAWDLILCDYNMPHFSGREALELLKESGKDIPLILISGEIAETTAVEMMEAGASDYLDKDNLSRLAPVIARELREAQVRADLRRTAEINAGIVANIGLGVSLITPEMEVMEMNRQMRHWFPEMDPSTRPRCYEHFCSLPGDNPCDGCPVVQTLQDGLVHERTLRHDWGGSTRLIRSISSPIMAEDGTVSSAVQITEDITSRHQLQAMMVQSERQASMGMLAAGVVHEINNPLAYILYNLEGLCDDLPILLDATSRSHDLLKANAGDQVAAQGIGEAAEMIQPDMTDEILDSAREALDGAYRIKDITFGLGTFSRIEEDDMGPVEIHYPIECAHTLAYNELKYRARLVKELNKVPMISASQGALSQVFLNLLINAAHAIDEGDVANNEIGIRTWTAGDWVYAEVKDTGKGIPEELLSQVFEPFYTTKEAGQGSGLGLSICRDIVRDLGGTIELESEVGVGTRVQLMFPTGSNVRTEERPSLRDGEEVPRGRMLVVDDEAPIRTILKRMLGKDHQVEIASSGEQAKTMLEQDSDYDILLCDLMMPHVSGMDLHIWLKKKSPKLAAHTVFITGGIFTPKCREYLRTVNNLQVEKPFDTSKLRDIVSDLVISNRQDQ